MDLIGLFSLKPAEKEELRPLMNSLIDLGIRSQSYGILSIEDDIENISDQCLKFGLSSAVDGYAPDSIRDVLEIMPLSPDGNYSDVDIVKRIIIIEGILGGVEQQENPKNLLSKIAGITGKAVPSDFKYFQMYTDTDFIFAAKERNHDKFIKSISSRDSMKYDGLRMASKFGDKELVLFLIKNGAEVNDKNHTYTALMMAAHGGHLEIVKLLIDNGADVSAINKSGETAVMIASSLGHTGIMEFLKQAGAGVPHNDNTKRHL